MKKIILDLCGGTGSWARPWKEAGYEVITITLPDYDVRSGRKAERKKIVFISLASPIPKKIYI